MAAKESQGLQAIIIIMTILTLGLGVGMLLVNNARKTQLARANDAEKRLGDANAEKGKMQADAANFKQWLGFSESDSGEAIGQARTDDMTRFAASMPEESRNYRTVIDNIYAENQKLVLNETNAKAEVKALKDRLLAVEAQKEEQVKKAEEAMKKSADDLASEKKKNDQRYDELTKEKEKIAGELEKLRADVDESETKLQSQKSAFDAKTSGFEHDLKKLREKLPEVDKFAQPADGRITWVNQRYGNVWINLGSDDGLRPQVTFSVAAEGLDDAEVAAKDGKGSIEVVRIMGPHMAEAKITRDDAKNPLVPGDRIYSQVWDRGRTVGFGVAGFVDIDKDGQSDVELLKDIIAASNGRVDAWADEKGKKQGEMKVDTRYLVLGERPDSPLKTGYQTSWEELGSEAETLGVQTIALEEFLKIMGWKTETRTVRLGPGARAEDFPPRAMDSDLPPGRVAPSGVFKKRLPNADY